MRHHNLIGRNVNPYDLIYVLGSEHSQVGCHKAFRPVNAVEFHFAVDFRNKSTLGLRYLNAVIPIPN
jgi:hypothetical protein